MSLPRVNDEKALAKAMADYNNEAVWNLISAGVNMVKAFDLLNRQMSERLAIDLPITETKEIVNEQKAVRQANKDLISLCIATQVTQNQKISDVLLSLTLYNDVIKICLGYVSPSLSSLSEVLTRIEIAPSFVPIDYSAMQFPLSTFALFSSHQPENLVTNNITPLRSKL